MKKDGRPENGRKSENDKRLGNDGGDGRGDERMESSDIREMEMKE